MPVGPVDGADLMMGGSASSFSKAKLAGYGGSTDQQSTAAHDSVRAVTSAGYIDARIDDDELEMEFRNVVTLSSQRGRHRVGAVVSSILLFVTAAAVRASVVEYWLLVALAGWFVANVAVIHTVFVFAKHASLEDYRRRFGWTCFFSYLGCFVTAVGTMDGEALQTFINGGVPMPHTANLALMTHASRLCTLGWNGFILNMVMAFLCFCDLPRFQAIGSVTSLVYGLAVSCLTTPGFGVVDFVFIMLHTACCLGCIVAFTHYNVIARQSFLYTKMLVAEVISEREQNAEARAVGEQAICAWVCHEIRNPLNALQFWYVRFQLVELCRLFC
jgi:hypothetical protein